MSELNAVEEVMNGEWIPLKKIAELSNVALEDVREIMKVLLESGIVNQKTERAGQYHRYLYRRAPLVCAECGKKLENADDIK